MNQTKFRPLKEIMTEAERYDNIKNLLYGIINKEYKGLYPVRAYNDGYGRVSFDVSIDEVKNQAKVLLNKVESGKTISCIGKFDEYFELYQYVYSTCEDKMYNFANSMAHRNDADLKELNKIRIWSILEFLLLNITDPIDATDDDITD